MLQGALPPEAQVAPQLASHRQALYLHPKQLQSTVWDPIVRLETSETPTSAHANMDPQVCPGCPHTHIVRHPRTVQRAYHCGQSQPHCSQDSCRLLLRLYIDGCPDSAASRGLIGQQIRTHLYL